MLGGATKCTDSADEVGDCCAHLARREDVAKQKARHNDRKELARGHDRRECERACGGFRAINPAGVRQRSRRLPARESCLAGSQRKAARHDCSPNSRIVYTMANWPVVAAKDSALIFQHAPVC